jgi:hypothetical protein
MRKNNTRAWCGDSYGCVRSFRSCLCVELVFLGGMPDFVGDEARFLAGRPILSPIIARYSWREEHFPS